MTMIYDSCCYVLMFLYLLYNSYDTNFGVMALTSYSVSNKIRYQQAILFVSFPDTYKTNHFPKRTILVPYIISKRLIKELSAKSKTIIDNDHMEDTKKKNSIDMKQQTILTDIDSDNDNENARAVVDTMTMKKAKWRKKRFFLLKEIHDMITSNPSLAVEKASHTMERWWNMCNKLEIQQQQQQQQQRSIKDDSIEKLDILYFRPTLTAYNLWIHAIAKSGMDNCGIEAERILKTVLLNNDSHLINRINVITYTNVMYAYAQQSKINKNNNNNNDNVVAAQHAERILYEWLTIVETKQQQSIPETRSLSTTTKSVDGKEEEESPIITSITCDTVLNAWAQLGTWEGAEHAEGILRRLEEYTTKITSTTSGSNKKRRYNTIDNNNINNAIRPTKHFYATVIHGWATCYGGGSKAAERATRILDRLLRKCNSISDSDDSDDDNSTIDNIVVPDTVMFNSCIHAWATSGDARAGNKALQLLNKMKLLYNNNSILYNNCYPDTVTYNTVLSAWSHSGHINAAIVAEKVLQQMVSEYTNYTTTTTTTTTTNTSSLSYSAKGPVPAIPCTISYNTVLHAWSISQLDGAVQRAEDILNYMISCHMIEGTKCQISPDVYSFTSVLNAIAKSKIDNKVDRAQTLLETMLSICSTGSSTKANNPNTDSIIKLSAIPFNAVINAAAFSAVGTTEEEKRTALQIAVSTFKRLQNIDNNIKPDSITYSTILKAIANLIPTTKNQIRNEMSLQIFTKCCQDGLVNDIVLNELHRAVQFKVLLDFIQKQQQTGSKTLRIYDGKIQYTDLPKSWSRNVPKKYTTTTSTSKPRTGAVSSSDLTTTVTTKIRRKEKSTKNDKRTTTSTTLRRYRAMSEESYQSGKDL